ncbi:MAG: alanine--tRNA ligase [Candidatus Azobacteroides pseudotrichonymphae]|jgi:alanyl-tRNA synthetase|nr:alanine--tRNA ligase [Bacteroidales bacterium OttesenSCG-928-I14]GMO35296.1 MAG: alanine--tRNA ligase [Candidatus Azobacteroides pseudotrichonymphae]
MTAKKIRQSFKDYFENKNHKIVSSSPMIIKNDPTLMFTNAGMNQFKDVILGNALVKYTRIANVQKCLRVNGKHNDLEEVGHDTYHHTMFEMLGNWSFGDYFKKEAIEYAWEYLTEILKLDKDRLYVTIFEGNSSEKLERDNEAANYWGKYLPKSHIIDGNKKDNFWEMGNMGPCGPCSEIHIDIRSDEEREKVDSLTLINKNHPQVIEIWNLVFMQFNRKIDGSLENLPQKVIDTGMGFERLCMVVQGKASNYDTDVFQTIIQAISTITKFSYGQNAQRDIAIRVVADHIRTIAFSIADGQLPSNTKAGYVIRRILRRAVRYSYTFLEQKRAFIYRLIPSLVDSMGEVYPELIAQKKMMQKVIKEEENSFLQTLEIGTKLLNKKIQEAKTKNKTTINGVDVFILYDTYGFPLDLIKLILHEQNMKMDKASFDAEMSKQKERARNATTIETGDWIVLQEGDTQFVGYDTITTQARILRCRKVKQKNTEYYQIVLDKTPFYAEMGGQIGDSGQLIDSNGISISIIDTKCENNLVIHIINQLPENLYDTFNAEVDARKRRATECNHTATHLLHEALRLVLGTHVEQKGSYVSSEVLRFDFSHFKKVTEKEIRQLEKIITKKIRQNIALEEKRHIPLVEARRLGAIALFYEKYEENVRVIKFGSSIELCGGTHTTSTGYIGNFRIISEFSISAGIRRIEAITAEKVESFFYAQQDIIHNAKMLLNHTSDLLQSIKKLISENILLKKQVETYNREKTIFIKNQVIKTKKQTPSGINLFILEGFFPASIVKDIAFQIGSEFTEKSYFAAATVAEGKPLLTIMISNDLVKNGLNASQIVREASKIIKGNGGGQSHFATAGGKDINGLPMALKEILNKVH